MLSNAVRAFISFLNNMQIAVLNAWCRVSSEHMCCKKKKKINIGYINCEEAKGQSSKGYFINYLSECGQKKK